MIMVDFTQPAADILVAIQVKCSLNCHLSPYYTLTKVWMGSFCSQGYIQKVESSYYIKSSAAIF